MVYRWSRDLQFAKATNRRRGILQKIVCDWLVLAQLVLT